MTPHGPAAVALALAGILLAGCTALGGVGSTPTPAPSGDPEVDVLTLDVGDCLDTRGKPRVTATVPVVDCSREHDSEAYAAAIMDDGDYPGSEAVKTRAQTDCVEAFAEFAGIDYEASALDYAYYFPTAGSWATGDRRILCLIVDPGELVTGSLEGAAR